MLKKLVLAVILSFCLGLFMYSCTDGNVNTASDTSSEQSRTASRPSVSEPSSTASSESVSENSFYNASIGDNSEGFISDVESFVSDIVSDAVSGFQK